MRSNNEHKTCPSSTCSEDAILLGKVKVDGTIGFFQNRMQLDAAAVEAFQQMGKPEQHFRFSSPCAQSGCNQWSGGNCGVIKKVLNALGDDLPPDAPSCLIRSTCRWFYQEGVQACYACQFVVTDFTEAIAETSML
jgi:hypothetical protein